MCSFPVILLILVWLIFDFEIISDDPITNSFIHESTISDNTITSTTHWEKNWAPLSIHILSGVIWFLLPFNFHWFFYASSVCFPWTLIIKIIIILLPLNYDTYTNYHILYKLFQLFYVKSIMTLIHIIRIMLII